MGVGSSVVGVGGSVVEHHKSNENQLSIVLLE